MRCIDSALCLYKFAVTGDVYVLDTSDELDACKVLDYKGSIYRGLYLPTETIVKDGIIEEWNGCTHWASDIDTAKRFLAGYEAEEYVEEYGLEHGTDGSFEEGFKLFSKVIMCVENPKDVLPLGRVLDEFLRDNPGFVSALEEYEFDSNDSVEDIIKEDEFSLFGYDFRIKDVEVVDGVYYVKVDQIERCPEIAIEDKKDDLVQQIQQAECSVKTPGDITGRLIERDI